MTTPTRANDSILLSALAELARALDLTANALATNFASPHSAILIPHDAVHLRVASARGLCETQVGALIPSDGGVIGVAVARRRTVRLGASASLRRYIGACITRSDSDTTPCPLPSLDDVQSILCVPITSGSDLSVVLFAESERLHAFPATSEPTLELIGRLLAARLRSGAVPLDVSPTGNQVSRVSIAPSRAPAPEPPRPVAAPSSPIPAPTPIALRCYESDDSVFVDGAYLVKGLPGRILRWILDQHVSHARVDFTNREIRLELGAGLAWTTDNLESRLVLLRKRLESKPVGLWLDHVGRGRLRLRVERPVSLHVEPSRA